MRTSAADRERAVDVLKAAFGEGRLTRDELDERTERAMSAKSYADLTQVVRDLPGAGEFGPPRPAPPQPRYYGAVQAPMNGLAMASLACSLFGFIPMASVASIIMGHVAHGQIRRTGQRGRGIATAGLALGYLALAGWILAFVLVVAATSRSGGGVGPMGPPGGG